MKNDVIKSLLFRVVNRGCELHIAGKYKHAIKMAGDSVGDCPKNYGPEPVEGHRFGTVPKAKPHSTDTVTAPLILFVHGLGCSKGSFDDAFIDPLFKKFQLLAPDLLGYGGSSRPQDFSYTMEDQAEVLRTVLENFPFEEIHIVVHSMGCAVGLLLAERVGDGDIVASFTNAEGNLIAEDCGLISRKTIEIPFEDFRDSVFDKFRSKGPRPWKELSAKADALAFYKSCESLVAWSDSGKLLQTFQELQAKKLYLYGDQNSDMEILDRLGDIKKVAIPNSGHFMMNDNPTEFYRQIAQLVG